LNRHQRFKFSDTEKSDQTDSLFIVNVSNSPDISAMISDLERQINQNFQQKQYTMTVDLSSFVLAPSRLIVLLLKNTSQARRLGGDIKLIGVKPMVKNSLVTFSPTAFISIEPTENYALWDFGEKVNEEALQHSLAATVKNVSQTVEEPESKNQVENDVSDEDVSKLIMQLKLGDADKIRVNSSVNNLYQVCDFVLQKARVFGFDESELAKIKVTVYEASLNVVEHAYFSNPDYWIDVFAVGRENKFFVIIQDWGQSFEFEPYREYSAEMAVKERKTGGFGLHIIKQTVDEIYYLADKQVGNRLILIKEKHLNASDKKVSV